MPAPSFVIIGAQKAGTSWLHTNLERHPHIWMPRMEMHGWRDTTLATYWKRFERETPVTGEKGPEYLHMPGYAISLMAKQMPETQFIVLLRKPSERAWSQARMEGSGYNQHAAPSLAPLLLKCASIRNRQRTLYGEALALWMRHAPGRVHVFFYDDVRDRPNWLLAEICALLGIEAVQPDNEAVWASPKKTMPSSVSRCLDRLYAPTVRHLKALGVEVPEAWMPPSSLSAREQAMLGFLRVALGVTSPYLLYHHFRFRRSWFGKNPALRINEN